MPDRDHVRPTAGSATGPGAVARTRSPRRTTSARPWTRSAATCWPAAACARRCASCCAAGWTGAAAWTSWPTGSAGCASRPDAAGDLGRHAGPGPGRARPGAGRRAGHPRRPRTTTPPGWPRWSWPRCRTTWPGRSGRWPTTTGSRRRPGRRTSRSSDMLRSEVLDAQFAGMKQALSVRRPARRCRPSRTCWPTSTRCWPRTPAARTRPTQFAEFMDKHGEFFPEQPEGRRRADRRPGPPAGRRGSG